MNQWLYLIGLMVAIAGIATLDWRYKLAIWHDTRRALITIAIGMVIFVVWDLLGIGLGIFFHGNGPYALPFRIFAEFPIEELFFLFLLCYVTLVLYQAGVKVWPRI